MTTRFDVDTAVELVRPGAYAGCIDRGWWIINGPNGGYLAAIVLRAMIAEVGEAERAPRSLTLHYLRPPGEGPVEVHTVTERKGRTLSTVSARLVQGDRLILIALAAFAAARDGFSFVDREAPALPPPDSCVRFRDKYPGGVEMRDRYDARDGTGDTIRGGGARARMGGWIRLEEPRVVDAPLVAAYTDSLPPAVFTRASETDLVGAVPTIDLTIHFRATLPLDGSKAEDFSAIVFTSSVSRDGFVEEEGEVWSESGVLLAQSRQLALVGA